MTSTTPGTSPATASAFSASASSSIGPRRRTTPLKHADLEMQLPGGEVFEEESLREGRALEILQIDAFVLGVRIGKGVARAGEEERRLRERFCEIGDEWDRPAGAHEDRVAIECFLHRTAHRVVRSALSFELVRLARAARRDRHLRAPRHVGPEMLGEGFESGIRVLTRRDAHRYARLRRRHELVRRLGEPRRVDPENRYRGLHPHTVGDPALADELRAGPEPDLLPTLRLLEVARVRFSTGDPRDGPLAALVVERGEWRRQDDA